MPFATVRRPSLALGLLNGYLTETGIESEVVYGNISFAEEIGLDIYTLLENISAQSLSLFGEWSFTGAVFPNTLSDDEEFFSLNREFFNGELAKAIEYFHQGTSLQDLMLLVRECTERYITLQAQAVLDRKPRLVGCTSMYQQHCASLALLRRIKDLDPSVMTILGGANCERSMGLQTHKSFPWVDFVACGEVDTFFGELVTSILSRGPEITADESHESLFAPYHRQHGYGVGNGASDRTRITVANQDMDRTCVPDYDDYFKALSESPIGKLFSPSLVMETSRGCWWGQKHQCAFCGLNGETMRFRKKSPERVLSEIDHLVNRYSVRRFFVADNILDLGYCKNVIETLGSRDDEPLHFFMEISPNLKREHLDVLSAAGFRWLQPGIESMHGEVLKALNKGTRVEVNIQFLRWARELGVRVFWQMLYGLPNEKDEWYGEMASWLPMLFHLYPPRCCERISFDRFSRYHREQDEYGLKLVPNRQYQHVFPLPPRECEHLSYFFEDENELSGAGSSARTVPGPGARELMRVVAEWNKIFHGRTDQRANLIMRDDGERLVVQDTRPIAVAEQQTIQGLDRRAYLLCGQPRTESSLLARLREAEGVDESQVRDLIARLCEQKLLLSTEGRYLSLAVYPSTRQLPDMNDAPWGHFDLALIAKMESARSSTLSRLKEGNAA
jgi:magnesium-protoporphyrin IX monomethyl ester (oxidative) cyclase